MVEQMTGITNEQMNTVREQGKMPFQTIIDGKWRAAMIVEILEKEGMALISHSGRQEKRSLKEVHRLLLLRGL